MTSRPAKRPKSINFDSKQIEDLKKVFEEIDQDGDGLLDEAEMGAFFKENDMPPQEAKLATFLFDSDHDGKISWLEFLQFMDASTILDSDPEKFFKLLFDAIDTDNSGELSKQEVQKVSDLFGAYLSDADVNKIFQQLDTDNSGGLSLKEVMEAIGF